MNEDVSRKAGFVADLNLECTKCNQTTAIMTSTSVTERGTSWDVNRRAVYHSVETGGGYEGLASFCSIMNMPCMTKTAYYKQESACWSIHKTGMPYKGQKTGQKLRCGSHRKGKEASEDRTTPAHAERGSSTCSRGSYL